MKRKKGKLQVRRTTPLTIFVRTQVNEVGGETFAHLSRRTRHTYFLNILWLSYVEKCFLLFFHNDGKENA